MSTAWLGETSLRQTLTSAKDQEAVRKYFEVENMKAIFGNVDSDLQALIDKTVGVREGAALADWKDLDSYLEALRDLLTIIVDQPYVNYFRSVNRLVNLMCLGSKASSVRLVLQLMGILVEGHYKHPGSKHILKLCDSIKAMTTTQAALVSLGFNANSGQPIALSELVDNKHLLAARCRELVVDSSESSFDRVTVDISRLVQTWREGVDQFKEETLKFVRERFTDLPKFNQELYASSIAWKSQLAAMIDSSDLNRLEDIILLILQGRHFSSKVAANFTPEHLAKLRPLQPPSDTPRDSFDELSQLMTLTDSSTFIADLLTHHFSLLSASTPIGQRSAMIMSMLADFNQDTMRRRSSEAQTAKSMDIEGQTSSLNKSAALLKVS